MVGFKLLDDLMFCVMVYLGVNFTRRSDESTVPVHTLFDQTLGVAVTK